MNDIIFTDKQSPATKTGQTISKTNCPYCGVGCGIEATVENNKVIAVKGNAEHPANLGRLCVKGSSLHETQGLQNRILHPRVKGKNVSWDEATSTIAGHFQETIAQYGPDSVAFYLSGQLLTEDYYVANKLMKGFIGSGNVDTNSRLCMASATAAHKRAFGEDVVAGCYDDLSSAEAIFIIGANPAYAHPIVYQRMIKAREENPARKIVVIDPRRTASAKDADLHLAIKPGSDAYFYNGLLIYLAEQGKLDKAYIAKHCHGFEQALETAQSQFSDISDVAIACDIELSLLLESYQIFAETDKVVTFFSQGINQSSSGVDKANAIINCHLATGKIGREGAGAFSITGQPNAMGGREVGGLSTQLAAHLHFENANEIDLVKRFWQAPSIATKQGLKAVELFDAVDSGKIKAIWIMATNPVVSMPNANLVKRALEKCPMVVVSECYENTDTINYADVVLPASTWGEKQGSVTNSDRTISVHQSMIKAPGEAKNDWQIITDVAHKLGFKDAFNYQHAVDIFREHATLSGFENSHPFAEKRAKNDIYRIFDISALANISQTDYENFIPTKWPINTANPNGLKRIFTDGVFATKNQKANFIPIIAQLPKILPDKTQVVMNSGRIRDQWHTMSRTGRVAKLMTHSDEPYIAVNPDDAQRFQLADKQLAVLSNLSADYIGRVNITNEQRTGEIFVPIHWNDNFSASARVSALVNPITDELCGQPELKHSPVNIKPFNAVWSGYLISSQTVNCPTSYWSKIQLEQGHKYLLSDKQELGDDETILANIYPQIDDWIVLKDAQQNVLRIAGFIDNKLHCFFAASTDLSLKFNSRYIEGQLNKTLPIKTRFTLMSGIDSDGKGDVGDMICSCFQVGENTIKEAIASQQCKSVTSLGEKLKCGTNCGSCIPELKTFFT
ncbi:nitrate reductase [Colwellia sp. PAMC 21821]|uniref:nitrate reductase n=1 Tax=Colwellia sp. PAMC 21821 TaxID=1816219 RepID=UPI0009C0401D|nr:nitrate reductase [Colwellia sp. PAMC 21821]